MTIHKWWKAAILAALIGAVAAAIYPTRLPSPLVGVVGNPPNTPRIMALTFDDGPSPQFTPEILQLLTRYNAHATFFVLGSEAAHFPQLVRDIIKQGSAVANHGYNHINYFQAGLARTLHDAAQAQALFDKEKIPSIPFYRPPFGNSNQRLVEAMAQKGYAVTLWSVDTHDWSKPGISYITRKVLTDAKPNAIVLMHDSGGNRNQTVAALAAILPVLKAEGYKFVTLSQYVQALGLKKPSKLPLPLETSHTEKNRRNQNTRPTQA